MLSLSHPPSCADDDGSQESRLHFLVLQSDEDRFRIRPLNFFRSSGFMLVQMVVDQLPYFVVLVWLGAGRMTRHSTTLDSDWMQLQYSCS